MLSLLSESTVHTSGINWASVGAIIGGITVVLSIMGWIFARRDKKNEEQNEAIKQEISTAIENLSTVLLAKLETKEKVAQISERLARLEGAANLGREQKHVD